MSERPPLRPVAPAPSPFPSVGDVVTEPNTAELLTPAEHRVVALLGEVASLYRQEVVADGPTCEHDWAEFASRIHDVQHAVMAQAAARAYPDLYRIAGGTLRALGSTDGAS